MMSLAAKCGEGGIASLILYDVIILISEYNGCFPFTQANRSVYRSGQIGQMVSKFPYWENSVRDWRLPFAEIPTIYQKICTTATADEKVALVNKTTTPQVRYFWYISLLFCAQLQREMTKFNVLCRTQTHDGEFSFL